ncbi:glycoside hydrolase family 27 protein [Microbacterium phosphatis]|uniref:glycoside hydrolase family 27 protein n=1 Tax=Microbacterium phosphatis TaxID=3140248 RepID=UPI0031403E46
MHDAQTPPMGWNSWDSYGTTVTEAEVLANAEFMATHLADAGWDTVVIDIDWSDPTARSHGYNADAPLAIDEWGRLIPDSSRFPSSADGSGFTRIAERVHALGLKLGIHIMRGIPRIAVDRALPILGGEGATAADLGDAANVCEWNPDMLGLDHTHPAARAYMDSIAALYAEWGIDFLKADDMLWPYQAADVEALSAAVARTGRDIAISLSPGRDLSLTRVDHLREHATMWRICDDLWDRWPDVLANFSRFARWAPFAGPEGWPDGDMLPLGRIGIRAERGEPRDDGLTPDERITLLTLWIIARSPLMVGGDLPTSDPSVIALLRNREAMAVLRDARSPREVLREDPLILWAADGADGERYAAAFNVGEEELRTVIDGGQLGLPAEGTLREVWSGNDVALAHTAARGVAPGAAAIEVALPAHGARLWRWDAHAPASRA